MRAAIVLLGAMAMAADASGVSAATIYPWCTTGAGHDFGGRNCGFVTFEQCMATARGNGQMCEQNPFYQGAGKPAPRAKKPFGARSKSSR